MKIHITSLLIIASTAATLSNCEKGKSEKNIPDCIKEKIKSIEQEKVWNPPAKIFQYQYLGKTVFYIPSHCCDIPGEVLDENCNVVCNPDGGITGKGDGRCTDFFNKRSEEKLIWSDSRK